MTENEQNEHPGYVKSAESQFSFSDGAYCLLGYNNHVFIDFFQQIPSIPDRMWIAENTPDSFADMNEDGIKRVSVGRVQMDVGSVKMLIANLQKTLEFFNE